jgi:NitT/TauT family transport system ATP-binding protein
MAVLKVKNLNFFYNSKIVLKDISLEFELGKIYALVGPSGVGKSTFAQLLAGHQAPTSGEILLNNKKINKPLKDIFIVHQEDDLFPWLTVYEQLAFVEESVEKINNLLKIFKLEDAKKLYPHELSGGMKKRLALIRAELLSPKVLILDETLSSLNPKLLSEILNEMAPRWRNKNITVILITHHLEEIKKYIDQVINFLGAENIK